MKLEKLVCGDGWTRGIVSSQEHALFPTFPYPIFGVALLYYRPERRLSVSIWTRRWSRNVRLFGPRKLSWER